MSYSSLLSAAIRRGGRYRAVLPPSASAIVSRPVTGSHLLRIDGYSNTKSILATGESIISRKFDVGGRKWIVKYYPNGYDNDCADSISVFVDVSAGYDRRVAGNARFSLLDHAGKPVSSCTDTMEVVDFKTHMFGEKSLIKREELERSENLLKNDCFTVRCDLTVMDEHVLTVDLDHQAVLAPAAAVVPPSDLHQHLAELLWSKEGADVAIQLDDDGETFHAHRWVLAARSPVLKAELTALRRKSSPATLRLAAMDTEAFKALLHFIYTDTLPDTMKQKDKEEEATMARRLLAAADMYKMERLKLICEDKLRKRIGTGNVAVMLALAEQHHCRVLKDACLEFLASPANLKAAMATEGFAHLKQTCPSVLLELVMKQQLA